MTKARQQQPPLTLLGYTASASQTDQFSDVPEGATKLAFGFFGEIGGLLSALKKVKRDKLKVTETDVAGEEIGDALWYLFSLAKAWGSEPNSVGLACLDFLRARFSETEQDTCGNINFRQIDGLISIHAHHIEGQRIELLGELARTSGEVVSQQDSPQLLLNSKTAVDLLGHLLALLGLVCSSFMLKLEDVAQSNLTKTHGRWPADKTDYINAFDPGYPEHEQLPRVLQIEFIERETQRGTFVVMCLNGVFIGDPLTDNSNEPDDYRFHDVFHLAYVAHLGWSPIIRALLKRKRKSNPKVDQNEDGARAMIIEEGIATWIFNHAKPRGLYEDVEEGKLDYGLLKQVHSMVTGYEVEACPLWQWERAILDGFRIFRDIRRPQHRGGAVVVDMDKHSIEFTPSARE